MLTRTRVGPAVLAGAACLSLPSLSAAQEFAGGVRMVIGFEQRFDAGGNIGLDVPSAGDTLLSSTRLSFGLTSQTRLSVLQFSASTALRIEDGPGSGGTDTEIGRPDLQFSFTREVPNALFAVTARYRQDNVGAFDIGDFIGEDGVITLPDGLGDASAEGTRTDSGATLRAELGRTAPLGFVISADYSATDYADTVDPDLVDVERYGLGLQARLRLSEVMTGTASLDYSHEAEDDIDQTVTDRRTATLGLEYAVAERLNFTASLGVTEIEREAAGLTDRTTGPVARFAMDYGMRNGTASVELSFETDEDAGDRVTLTAGRAMELRSGSLSARLGVTKADETNTDVIGELAWVHRLRDGQIDVRLSREAGFDDDESVVNTALTVGWDHQLNDLSSFGLDFSYAVNDAPSERVTLADLGATYRYSLTDDWSLNTGLRYRVRTSLDGRAESPSVFVAIGRSFEFRP